MQRIKQLTPPNTIVDEVVRRIRNPLNALLLNIDNLEDEIAEIDIAASRERLRRMRNTVAELDSLLCEVLRLSELPSPESRLLTSMRWSGMWKLLPNPSHRKRNWP